MWHGLIWLGSYRTTVAHSSFLVVVVVRPVLKEESFAKTGVVSVHRTDFGFRAGSFISLLTSTDVIGGIRKKSINAKQIWFLYG